MNVGFVYTNGDGDLHNVTKLTELEPGLYKLFVEDEDPHAIDDAAITTITSTDEPFSVMLVDGSGSGVCEAVVRIEQRFDAPNDFEVEYDDGRTETYTDAAVTDALDQPTFDDQKFADNEPLWEPYNNCPFCRGDSFDERAVYEQTVDAPAGEPLIERGDQVDRLAVSCRHCGKPLLG